MEYCVALPRALYVWLAQSILNCSYMWLHSDTAKAMNLGLFLLLLLGAGGKSVANGQWPFMILYI